VEDSLDLLLLQILQEIVYYKDAEHLFLRCDSAHIEKSGECWKLSAKLAGEPIDTIQHEMLADVKAVTLHLLAVERAASGWTARAVLDI
jgi:SHS2 domain-containing protein